MEQANKVQPNNFENERLAISDRRRNDGDLVGALTVLLNIEEEGTKNINVLSKIAALYFDMELFVLSSEYWFKYMSQSNSPRVRLRAYSGLSACFCMLGDTRLMAYYSEKQLALGPSGEQEYDSVLLDYYDYVYDAVGDGYYVSYPEKYISPKRLMFEADALIEARKDMEAAERLSFIQKDSEYYCEARSKMAQCYLVSGKDEEAEKILADLVAEFPDNNFANLSYGLFLLDDEKTEDAEKYLIRAIKGDFYDEEDYFRLAVALCRVEKDSEALFVLEKALEINEYCLHVLFLTALISHNLGDDEKASALFKKVYSLTRGAVSRYYYGLTEKGDYKEKLEYTFNLPKNEAAKRFAKITLIIANGKKAIASYGESEVMELLDWCLPYVTKLQFEFVEVLLTQGTLKLKNHVIGKLISPTVSNEIKIFIIETLIMRDSSKRISVAFDNVFIKIPLLKGDFEKTRNDFFKRAYAFSFARLCPFGTDTHALRDTAYKMYYKFKDSGYLKKISDVNALGCAMAIESGFKMKDKLMYEAFFQTKKSSVDAILNAYHEEDGE